MPSTISAGTTAGTAIAVAGDTTGNLAFQTNGTTTAMTIDTSQNVGIGTTSPTQKLSVTGNISVSSRALAAGFFNSTNVSGMLVSATTADFYTNNAFAMGIDSSGRVTMPSQPFFYARKDNSQSITAGTRVDFSTTVTNIGSHYNSSISRFTAPIAGVYSFTAKIWMSKGGGSYASFDPRINGSLITGSAGAYYDGSINSTGLANYIVNFQYSLNASDYVDFVVGGNATLPIDNSGYFCGFLLS